MHKKFFNGQALKKRRYRKMAFEKSKIQNLQGKVLCIIGSADWGLGERSVDWCLGERSADWGLGERSSD